jgi:uncharacterized protein (TIGR02246 family)
MSPTVLMAIVSAATVGLAVSYAMIGNAQPPSGRENEEAIQKIIVETTAGFNAHDAQAATRMYTADADFVTVMGEKYKGAAEIEQELAALFRGRNRDATLKPVNVTIRFIRSDVAIAHVTNELRGVVRSDGLQLPPHQELSLRVFVKEAGAWHVTAFHNTRLRPLGAPAGPR